MRFFAQALVLSTMASVMARPSQAQEQSPNPKAPSLPGGADAAEAPPPDEQRWMLVEQELAELRAVASDPAFYQRPHLDVQQSLEDLQEAERAVNAAVDRWAELEEQAAAAARGDAS